MGKFRDHNAKKNDVLKLKTVFFTNDKIRVIGGTQTPDKTDA